MNFKFYLENPALVREDIYSTIDGDKITVKSTFMPDGERHVEAESENDGELDSGKLSMIKLSPIGNLSRFVEPISRFDQLQYTTEYGFFCREIDGVVYTTDFGAYGEVPEWATHFTCMTMDEYNYYGGPVL